MVISYAADDITIAVTTSAGQTPARWRGRCYPRTIVLARLPAPSFIVLLACACSSRQLDDSGDGSAGSADTSDELEPGDQPTTPGSMFTPCTRSSECIPQEFCVFPQDEAGYCTSACIAPTDPSSCDPPPGDQPPTCFDIGLDDGRRVCALDCAAAPCPRGMRCEHVATGDGERSICF